ncbi:MAG: jacalin-like lectin [Pseudomonadota bacterium]
MNVSVTEGVVELSQALQIDQSLSVDYAGIAKVDQKMQFVRKQKATSTSINIVVYARHENASRSARNPKMTVDTQDMKVADFVDAYGDSYIESVDEGGEYYAVYTFFTETKSEQTALKASLKASGIYSGVSASGSLEIAIDNFVKTTNTAWTFDQEISGIQNPVLPTRDTMVDFAIKFPSIPLDAPVVIGMTTTGYEHVPDLDPEFKEKFAIIIKNRRYFVGSRIDGGLTEPLVKIASLQNSVAVLEEIYGTYGYDGDTGLREFRDLLEENRKAISAQFVAYEDDPVQDFTPPDLPSLDKGTPVLTFDKGTSALWGGGGGGPFDFPPIQESLRNRQTLRVIRLRSGSEIDAITLGYRDMHGDLAAQKHGGGGGSDQNALSFDPGEFVTQVDVRSGRRIDNLKITTNRGASTQGGGGGGGPHTWSVPDGAVVLGFQGRSGARLDAIQVVYAALKPAEFRPNS